MVAIWIALFFGATVMAYTVIDAPKKEAAVMTIAADVDATNFMAYRRAVQAYLQINPSATGTVNDAALAGYWLPGYIRDPNWTNVIDNNSLYVYSTSVLASGTLEAMWKKSSENLLVGIKNSANGRLRSFNGFDTGIVLPLAIPNNAVVMMGR